MAAPDPGLRPGPVAPAAVRFESADRRWLLRSPGIGPGVIQRLEAVGVRSLDELAARGVDLVVADICRQLRTPAWGNRRAALERALSGTAAGR